jgi:hypothetical protein
MLDFFLFNKKHGGPHSQNRRSAPKTASLSQSANSNCNVTVTDSETVMVHDALKSASLASLACAFRGPTGDQVTVT